MQVINMNRERLCLDSTISQNHTGDDVNMAKCHKQGGNQVHFFLNIHFYFKLPLLQRTAVRFSRLCFSEHIVCGYIISGVFVGHCTSNTTTRFGCY